MIVDAWLPLGHRLPNGVVLGRPLSAGESWQLWESQDGGRTLIVKGGLVARWERERVLSGGEFTPLGVGGDDLRIFCSGPSWKLQDWSTAEAPSTKSEALALSVALRETRATGCGAPLQEALYVEEISRFLPTYSLSVPVSDDVTLGVWLTGGVAVSVLADRRLRSLIGWMTAPDIMDVVEASGLRPEAIVADSSLGDAERHDSVERHPFRMPGRPELERFFQDHVIDILENRDRYRAMGITFPSAMVLHGPPGCGKTFAVERLVEYLGWPSYSIDSSSVASPYIHDTSKKIAGVFDTAIKNAPSVLVIDEMEAYLADRENVSSSGHHHVEEVAEFLRRIPEAVAGDVLVVAMTNRVEMIDPAVLRRGRFDHVIEVGMASAEEVHDVLRDLMGRLPTSGDVDLKALADTLAGRPLSDVAFVVREAARLAAKAGIRALDQQSLKMALSSTPARQAERTRPIGFGGRGSVE